MVQLCFLLLLLLLYFSIFLMIYFYIYIESVSGRSKPVSLKSLSSQEVATHVHLLINSDGEKKRRIKHYNVGKGGVESVQGKWTERLDVKSIQFERVKDKESLQL